MGTMHHEAHSKGAQGCWAAAAIHDMIVFADYGLRLILQNPFILLDLYAPPAVPMLSSNRTSFQPVCEIRSPSECCDQS
jgi:hypothetical protein